MGESDSGQFQDAVCVTVSPTPSVYTDTHGIDRAVTSRRGRTCSSGGGGGNG
jgi:hypothetical protein